MGTERDQEAGDLSAVKESSRLGGGSAPDTTEEQRKRDKMITELLKTYMEAYKRKAKEGIWYRRVILGLCVGIIGGFAFMLWRLPGQFFGKEAGLEMEDMVSFVTACVSFLTLIIGVLHIITKYFFPENDEEYITRIVKSIQDNDLENRKETARSRLGSPGTGKETPTAPETVELTPLEDGEKP